MSKNKPATIEEAITSAIKSFVSNMTEPNLEQFKNSLITPSESDKKDGTKDIDTHNFKHFMTQIHQSLTHLINPSSPKARPNPDTDSHFSNLLAQEIAISIRPFNQSVEQKNSINVSTNEVLKKAIYDSINRCVEVRDAELIASTLSEARRVIENATKAQEALVKATEKLAASFDEESNLSIVPIQEEKNYLEKIALEVAARIKERDQELEREAKNDEVLFEQALNTKEAPTTRERKHSETSQVSETTIPRTGSTDSLVPPEQTSQTQTVNPVRTTKVPPKKVITANRLGEEGISGTGTDDTQRAIKGELNVYKDVPNTLYGKTDERKAEESLEPLTELVTTIQSTNAAKSSQVKPAQEKGDGNAAVNPTEVARRPRPGH